MLLNNKGLFGTAIMLALIGGGACAAQPQQAGSVAMAGDTPIPLEPPYAVGGVTYTPADPASYDEVGYAGVIEDGSRGGSTATGEAFMPSAIMAAHKTLPLPSYVEVTALDSGRTILVRVNDRGPMRNDQLIALTPGAAAQLGVAGIAAVRVRRVNPPDQERAVLRGHGRAAERLETPAALLKVLREKLGPVRPAASTRMAAAKPRPAAAKPVSAGRPGADFDTPAPKLVAQPAKPAPRPTPAPPTTGGYVVQVGAFSSQARADSLAKRLGAHVASGDGIWRVRLGPYATQQAAQTGVRHAAAKGFENSRIMANDAR
ncbi:RlpA-like double-psi beta-barrel domain-containing protein [Sphingobium cupriresistens]|uniref:Endolytic peptidoglycan transglycosylase RlpA n=1 Tax=Sphingobium cupriresistens TaxID=1132417 RepID=A0A8G1ZFW4_9SPHN|nr:RlpA-like double-psi beta-barrel domain-containing protein [Sphingobium cupriresistens]RYM09666.1 septal ring lytic transglycosylase RlpA family lipoprotein [Sphingobium cupriresistens]